MGKAIREHVRSNVVGCIAIFLFAMGGTAYALGQADIATGGVGSAEIVDVGLSNQDISVFREDPMTDSNPENLWGNLFTGSNSKDCADPSRMVLKPTDGPAGGPYREVSVHDGDNASGERCELGNNSRLYGLASPTNRSGSFFLYPEGSHYVTSYWLRLGSNYPLQSGSWQVVTQMKQTQPYAGASSSSPILSLEARAGRWRLLTHDPSETQLHSWPAERSVWTMVVWDVVYSKSPAIGSVTMILDGVASTRTTTRTLAYATASGSGLAAGDPIPSHLRIGPYHYSSLPGTHIDVGPVQVVDVSPVQVAVP
jgi:Polysaccharide lyase